MLETALDLFDERQCPVCETPWKPEEFRAVVNAQRQLLEDAATERKAAEEALGPAIATLEEIAELLRPVVAYARNLPSPIDNTGTIALGKELVRRAKAARAFLPLDETIDALQLALAEMPDAERALAELAAAVDALPELSDRDAARDFLTVGQERLEAWRLEASRHSAAEAKAALAEKVHTIYGETCDQALEAIYKDVEGEFRAFYRTINGDDESKFEAQLTPSLGKLGFAVDFYGKGFFPPGAYHSEGHQDGMGLCLYLALMKYLLGDRFTFAVLDDVLMSVDAGHRREVCSLLRAEFPNTQFVLTTHDNVWLNHMRTSKLVEAKSAITFRKWHVDHGPAEWKDTDVWAEIDEQVANNEIRAASGQLRHYLEYVSAEWCARLGGRVEYRSDGKYELGDLLPAAIGAMNDLYKKAKAAAQSWGDKERVAELTALHASFTEAVTATNVEQWQINQAVHYNAWANLQREDFAPVVAAFKELERRFGCPSCGDPLYVVRTGKEKEAVRCACSKTQLNLKPKVKAAE
jgi:rubredoxin